MKRILRFALFGFIGLCIFVTIIGAIANRITPSATPTVIIATPTKLDAIAPKQTESMETPKVTETPTAPIKAPPLPTITIAAANSQPVLDDNYDSGGLGLSKAAFDKKYGPDEGKATLFTAYQGKSILVSFGTEGNVNYLQHRWPQANFASKEDAQAIAKLYLPHDAKLLKTYYARGDITRPVELYMSKSLVTRSDYWPGEDSKPGYFIVTYGINAGESSDAGKVSSIIIANGNNP